MVFDEVVGEKLNLNDDDSKSEILTEWTGFRWAHVRVEDEIGVAFIRVRSEQAIKGFFNAQCKSNKSNTVPVTLKKLAVNLYKRMVAHKSNCRAQRVTITKKKSLIKTYRETIEKEQLLQKKSALIMHQDTHTIPSIENKIETAELRLKEAEAELTRLEGQSNTVFSSTQELLEFFKKMGVSIPPQTLSDWSRGQGLETQIGRPHAMSVEAERKLMEVILYRDKMGMPMDYKAICTQAAAFIVDPKVRQRFSDAVPSKKWFKLFLKRAKKINPSVTTAITRGTECRTLKWFNSNNVNWWFDTFTRKIIELGFARAPTPEEKKDCEAVWLDNMLTRVVISDETCVSGGNTRKMKNTRCKVVTTVERIETTDKGGGQRRVAPLSRSTEEHITLLATVTITGQVGPPVWVLAAKTDIRHESRRIIERISSVCGGIREWDLPLFNGRYIKEPIITVSPRGGITQRNVTPAMMKAFKAMYPDVNDSPGKRVLWLTDWHDSRLSIEFIKAMREMGVVMMGWLPNITSKAQLPDVTLFGPFKSRRERLEQDLMMNQPGVRIDRHLKIQLACQAMRETFTADRILKGAKLTGMNPISRKPLLEHPSIQDGDVLYDKNCRSLASHTLEVVQKSPSSSTANSQSLIGTPQRMKDAETTYTSISQQKPRLGPWRTFTDSTPTHEDIQKVAKKVRKAITNALYEHERDIEDYLSKAEQHVQRGKEKLDSEIEKLDSEKKKLDRELITIKNSLKQEHSQLKFFKKQMEQDELTPHIIANIGEKVEDITTAERDEFGLPISVSSSKDAPLLDDMAGYDVGVLRDSISVAERGAAIRAGVNKRGPSTTNPVFRIGAIMHNTGEIESTSDRVYQIVKRQKEGAAPTSTPMQKNIQKRTTLVSGQLNNQLGIPQELNDLIVKMLSENLNTLPDAIYRAALSEESLKELLEPADDPGDENKKEISRKFRQRVANVKKKMKKVQMVT